MTVHIQLRGSKAERFQEIKATADEELGYEASNPELLGMLMACFGSQERTAPRTLVAGDRSLPKR